MEQRSQEWFDARRDKLTGSNVGAALGLNPYKTPDALIREMVRNHHGAESEFTGNVATEYGTLHEPLAQMDYTTETGNMVRECGFFVCDDADWLGASPDGLIGEDGLIEIKCPYGQRDKNPPQFKSLQEQPHYYAQVQIEMLCAKKKWVDFYQWSEHGTNLERVEIDYQWLDDHWHQLEDFYKRFLDELTNPAHLEDQVVEVNTLRAMELLQQYDDACLIYDSAAETKKQALADLVDHAKGRNAIIHGRKLTKVERSGSVQYAKIVKESLPDIDLEPYRGKPTEFWKLC